MLRMKESAGASANGDPVSGKCLPHRPTQRDIASWAEGPTLQQPCGRPFPHALCLPARNLVLWSPAAPLCPSALVVPLSCPCHALVDFVNLSPAPTCFLPPRFHHLLLFEPVVALVLWFVWQHYSPSPCLFPALLSAICSLPRSHQSIPGLDWVGPRWAVAMFYFGPGPAGGNTNLLDTSTRSHSIDPPAPTHDNSPSP